MNTKMIVCLVAVTLLSASFVEAQQPTKVPRIGFLNALFPTTNPARIEAFRQGLRDVGYVEATNTIPIVMTNEGDPVETGFVASLARPGGNITGLSTLSPELSGKRLELLKESFPSSSVWPSLGVRPTPATRIR